MNQNMNPNFQHQNPYAYTNPYSHTPNYSLQQDLPNTNLIHIFGILSVVIVLGLIGYVFGWIALAQSKAALRLYTANPQAYTPSSYHKVKTGRTCALIGVIIYSILIAALFVLFGVLALAGDMY
jgi:hypothetical protein